jgi:hypothetical protein
MMIEMRAEALHRQAMLLPSHDHLWEPTDFAAAGDRGRDRAFGDAIR